MRVDYGICLADYCDIFECREIGDRNLKTQTFMDRNTTTETFMRKGQADEPYRYYLVNQLP